MSQATKLYSEMDMSELLKKAPHIIQCINTSHDQLGRFLHAALVHCIANRHDSSAIKKLYQLLSTRAANTSLKKAFRHAAEDCAALEIKTNNKREVTVKKMGEKWALIKDKHSATALAKLIANEGAGLDDFVVKVKRTPKADNDDDAGDPTKAGPVSDKYNIIGASLVEKLQELQQISVDDERADPVLGLLYAKLRDLDDELQEHLSEMKMRLGKLATGSKEKVAAAG